MLEEVCPKARSFVPTTSLSMFALSTLEIFNVVDFMDSSDKPYCPHPLQIFPSVPLLHSAAASGTAMPCSLGKAMVFTAPALKQSLVLSLRQPEVKYLWGQGRAVSLSGPISAQKQFQTQFALQLSLQWLPALLNIRTKLKACQHAGYPHGCSYKCAKVWQRHSRYI